MHTASYYRQTCRLAAVDFGGFHQGWDEVTEIYVADGRLTLRTPPLLLKNAGAIQQAISPQCNWRRAQAFVDDVLDSRQPLSLAQDALEDVRLIEGTWGRELERLHP